MVTYNGNNNTSGSVPTDATAYLDGINTTVTVLGNTGNLQRTGYTYANWNTQSNGEGTNYSQGSTFTISSQVTLFAKWTPITYTVRFNKNASDATGTMADESFTYGTAQNLTLNEFQRPCDTFIGWSTSSTGAVVYTNGQNVNNLATVQGTVVNLYAQWKHLNVDVTTTSVDANYCKDETAVTALNASVVGGSGTPTYQWYKNGTAIGGANSATYTPPTDVSGDFDYSVKAGNPCDDDSIHIANIHIYDAVVASTTSIDAVYCKDEATVTNLNAAIAGGNGSPTYQWYKNGTAISGANTNTYTPDTDVSGDFDYSVKVSNTCGSDSIHIANIHINPLPTITPAPLEQTIPYGSPITAVVINNTNSNVTHPTLPTGFAYDAANQKITAPKLGVGNYAFNVYAVSDQTPNCGTVSAEVKVTVTKNSTPIVITSGTNSWMYNGSAHSEETYTVTYNGVAVTNVDATGKVFTLPTGDTLRISNPASITKVSETADNNNTYSYTLDSASYYTNVTANYGKLTIQPRTVTMTSATASRVYDGTPLTRNLQTDVAVTGDGFVSGEGAIYNITGTQTFFGSSENTFTYTLNSGTLAENYTINTTNGTLSISKRSISISVPSTLTSKQYDGSPLTVDFGNLQVTNLASTDHLVGGTITTDGYGVGEYPIYEGNMFSIKAVVGYAIKSGFSIEHSSGEKALTLASYSPSFSVTLSITAAPLQITANSDTKEYDGTPLTLTNFDFTVTGGTAIAPTDSLVVTITGTQTCQGESASHIASYQVLRVADLTDVTTNYDPISTVDGLLKVTPTTIPLACPATVVITLTEGNYDTVVPQSLLGTPTHTLITSGHAHAGNNLSSVNPMRVGNHTVTWTLYDDCDSSMVTCDQTVTVQYQPCEGTLTVGSNSYAYKRIGYQCWFTENLRETSGVHSPYGDDASNVTDFGYLYTWYTAAAVTENDDAAVPTTATAANGTLYVQGICPTGWSIGSESDYMILNTNSGGTEFLKEPSTLYWLSGYEGTAGPLNTGFKARGGGWFNSAINRYEDFKTNCHFWRSDSTPGSSLASSSVINFYCDSIVGGQNDKHDKRSVRCIRKVNAVP